MACSGRTAIRGRIVIFHLSSFARCRSDSATIRSTAPRNRERSRRISRVGPSIGWACIRSEQRSFKAAAARSRARSRTRGARSRRVRPLQTDEGEWSRGKPRPVRSNGELRLVEPPEPAIGPDRPAARPLYSTRRSRKPVGRRDPASSPRRSGCPRRDRSDRTGAGRPRAVQAAELLCCKPGKGANVGSSLSIARNARSACFAFSRVRTMAMSRPSAAGRCRLELSPISGKVAATRWWLGSGFAAREIADHPGGLQASCRCQPGRGCRPSPVARRLGPDLVRCKDASGTSGTRLAAMYSRRSSGSRAGSGGPGRRVLGSESLSWLRVLPRGDRRPLAVRLRFRLPLTTAAAAQRPGALCSASRERSEVNPLDARSSGRPSRTRR